MGPRPGAEFRRGNVLRVLEVVEEQADHLRSDPENAHHQRGFVVQRHRSIVEVHRADRRPLAIDDEHPGMDLAGQFLDEAGLLDESVLAQIDGPSMSACGFVRVQKPLAAKDGCLRQRPAAVGPSSATPPSTRYTGGVRHLVRRPEAHDTPCRVIVRVPDVNLRVPGLEVCDLQGGGISRIQPVQ
jgi:hypothetical protein